MLDERILDYIEVNKEVINDLNCSKESIRLLEKMEKLKKFLENLNGSLRNNREEEQVVFAALDNFFSYADNFSKKVNNRIFEKKTKKFFRSYLSEYVYKSQYFKRGYKKPKGYPGDFFMLEAMYDNCSKSSGIGYYFDRYFLKNNYVQVVRDRKDWMKNEITNLIIDSNKSNLKILNLACGGCREIREIVRDSKNIFKKSVEMTLVDQDLETLDFCKKKLGIRKGKVKFHFKQNDVLDFVKNSDGEKKKYDIIYSIGLLDYLPDGYLMGLMSHCFNLLEKNGILIVAHKNLREYSAPVADWLCDWRFIPRGKEEFFSLIKGNLNKESYKVDCIFTESKLVYFYIIKKMGES